MDTTFDNMPAQVPFEKFLADIRWRLEHELRKAGLSQDNYLRDDATSESLFALWRMYKKFKGRVGGVAGRYVHTTIRNGIANAYRKNSNLPRRLQSDVSAFRRLRKGLEREEAIEAARDLGWSDKRIRETLAASSYSQLSLDDDTLRSHRGLSDTAPSPLEVAELEDAHRVAAEVIEGLEPSLRRVVKGRLEGRTLRDLAADEGVTFQAIQLRFLRARKQLLHRLRVLDR